MYYIIIQSVSLDYYNKKDSEFQQVEAIILEQDIEQMKACSRVTTINTGREVLLYSPKHSFFDCFITQASINYAAPPPPSMPMIYQQGQLQELYSPFLPEFEFLKGIDISKLPTTPLLLDGMSWYYFRVGFWYAGAPKPALYQPPHHRLLFFFRRMVEKKDLPAECSQGVWGSRFIRSLCCTLGLFHSSIILGANVMRLKQFFAPPNLTQPNHFDKLLTADRA